MLKNQNEVDCVYTILLVSFFFCFVLLTIFGSPGFLNNFFFVVISVQQNCHRYPPIRDEVYCQLMKQTTSNKSPKL